VFTEISNTADWSWLPEPSLCWVWMLCFC